MEIVIVCRAHRRRCRAETAAPGGKIQLWHDGIGRNGGNMCSSQRFLYRIEEDLGRDEVLAKLAEVRLA